MDPLLYMQRALELAAMGKGKVSPNPMVGCVIVYKENIIGEGWHRQYGGPHAEVNAVVSVADKSLLKESTVYVTLEPCAHFGKTPPCADLLIQYQVKKVVIAATDSNPLVGGKGIARMREAGIEVETGLLEKESIELNKRFFTDIEKKRPFIILKWAETADGFIARKNFDSKWISNQYSRKLVHKWRTEEDAILVGPNTAHYDNPQLTSRDWEGRNPVRVVIDRNLRLASGLNLFDGSQLTICYNLSKDAEDKNISWVKIPEERFLVHVLEDLRSKGIQSVLVEGGAGILNEFITRQLWDEIRVFKADVCFGEGIAAPVPAGVVETATVLPEGDRLLIFKPKT